MGCDYLECFGRGNSGCDEGLARKIAGFLSSDRVSALVQIVGKARRQQRERFVPCSRLNFGMRQLQKAHPRTKNELGGRRESVEESRA